MSETITVECRGCERTLRFKQAHAGRKTECRQCGFELRVPGAEGRVRLEARAEGLVMLLAGSAIAAGCFFVAWGTNAVFYGFAAVGGAMAVKGLISLVTGIEKTELDRRGL
jgi:hypothetical protein